MPWAAAAMAGGAALSYTASRQASDAQQQSASDALGLQREQYQAARQDSAPYRQTGAEALNRIRAIYGMAPITPSTTAPQESQNFDSRAYLAANPDVAAQGVDPYWHYQNYGRGEGRQFTYTPAAQASMSSTATAAGGAGAGRQAPGTAAGSVTGANGFLEMDPGYQFRMDQGNQALERSAAARGGLLSGGAARDLAQYSQGLASQEYGNAYNRMASLAGIGQTQVNSDNQLGANYAGNASNTIQGAGNARASGYVGGANALTSAVGTGLNYYQGNQMLDTLNGRRSSSNGGDPLRQWGVIE